MAVRICDLREKEVINICDCKRIGCVMDVDIDVCTGHITALIVPGPCRLWGFLGKEFEYVIPWCRIRQIGPDIILAEVLEEDIRKQ